MMSPSTNHKSHDSGGSGGMATLAPLIWTPRPYLVGDDFALWINWFEAYTHVVRIPDEKLSDACWTMLRSECLICLDYWKKL